MAGRRKSLKTPCNTLRWLSPTMAVAAMPASVPLAKEPEMVLFSLLRTQYPGTNTPCMNAGGQPTFRNQCAIRMSVALMGAGLSFESYSAARCPHGHARLAQELADWLRTQLGAPTSTATRSTERTLRREIVERQGIIFFRDCFFRPGEATRQGDHIDLWDCGSRVQRFCWFPPAATRSRCGSGSSLGKDRRINNCRSQE